MTILPFIQMWKTLFWRKYAITAGWGKIFSFTSTFFFFLIKKIYLAVLHLSFDMQTLRCGIWDIVPWPWIEPRLPALGTWSLATGPSGKFLTNILIPTMWQKLLGTSATSMKTTVAFDPTGNLCERKTIYVDNNNKSYKLWCPLREISCCDGK